MAPSLISENRDFEQQFTRISRVKEPGIYLIACEGSKDEPEYVREFVKENRIRARVFIAEREPDDFGTNPWHIYNLLKENSKRLSIPPKNKSIHHWIMIDRDKDRICELREVKKQCDIDGTQIAYSSPCIELWFLLHYKDLDSLSTSMRQNLLTPKNLKKHLKRNCLDIKQGFYQLFSHTKEAINRAKAIDKPSIDFPEDFCTRVYILIQELMDFQ